MSRILKEAVKLALVFTGVSLAAPSYASAHMSTYGYIDPGTGTYIFQMVVAMLLGSLFAIKRFWTKITGFFKKD